MWIGEIVASWAKALSGESCLRLHRLTILSKPAIRNFPLKYPTPPVGGGIPTLSKKIQPAEGLRYNRYGFEKMRRSREIWKD
jgi:hypothetical protein